MSWVHHPARAALIASVPGNRASGSPAPPIQAKSALSAAPSAKAMALFFGAAEGLVVPVRRALAPMALSWMAPD
ncbi:MAG: hypothetical protein R3D62_19620 [Xanthobacteraceae bacterium]